MPSSRLDSHRNSVQNGMVERFTAFMATIFVPNFNFYAAATFCPLDGNGKKEQKTKKLRKAGQVRSLRVASLRAMRNNIEKGHLTDHGKKPGRGSFS